MLAPSQARRFIGHGQIRRAMLANDFRKLAAIDILFFGYRVILAEYAVGVLFSVALGLFVLLRAASFLQVLLGTYFVCLGINYVPMLSYSIAIANKQNARAEIFDELGDKRTAMSKYRRKSLFLLVPLLIPTLAVVCKLRARPK